MPKHYIVSRGSFNTSLGVYRPILDNILTFEVEDRFHVENPDMELPDARSRIIPLIMHLLDMLDDQKARATFFVLGWVARKFPEVVALIDSRGNEVASHGFTHGDIRRMSPEEFRNELVRSKEYPRGHNRQARDRVQGRQFSSGAGLSFTLPYHSRGRLPI